MTSVSKVQAVEIIDLDSIENNKPKNEQQHVNCDIQWSDLNFKVGDKNILQNCWGNVSHASFKSCFESIISINCRFQLEKFVLLWG